MIRLSELAALVDGSLHGDGDLPISGAAPLAVASEGQITLVDSAASLELLAQSPAAAVVVPRGLPPAELPAIEVDNLHAAFSTIIRHFRPARAARDAGVSPEACVDSTARIDPTATIYPGAFVEAEVEIGPQCTIHSGVRLMAGCRLGSQVTVFPNAVLYENTVVGDRCLIHAGAVLGAHGFGYDTVGGRHQPSAQLGNVVLETDVEIGACATVDRGTYGPTIVGEGSKLDNHVMIAHNCRLGKHNLICSQAGIAGSTTTGDYVVMAGQVGVPDHVHVGQGAMLGAKAGVMGDIPAGGVYVGIPATPQREQFLKQAALARLPEMRKQVKALEKAVARLQAQGDDSCQEAA